MKILVLSPHRDDAAFSLGLAIDTWLAAGHKVQVLNFFTQSLYAPYSDAESLHRNDRVSFVSAVRRREDIAWNKMLRDRLEFHDLDLHDAPLRLNCDLGELPTLEIRAGDRALARAAGAVAKLTRNATPETTAVLAPLCVGAHIDHRIVRQAAIDTLATSALPFAFYEDLPYAAREEEAGRHASHAADLNIHLEPTFAAPPLSDPAAAVQRKMRMAECYDSQIDSEMVRIIGEFSRTYEGRERLWANHSFHASALSLAQGASAV